ncbi:MAG TPA: hypothetical protein VFN48_00515 [Solirubrobacteraceae bacterium]|nr:hypothetical protein [Solirubrobacteraceae bacterium]
MMLVAASGAQAKPSSGSSGTTGYDISYPQCGGAYPSSAAFGIIGVNGGLANDANSCFSSELTWAQATPGLSSPGQPGTSLYINTADPGPAVTDWPQTGSATAAYGICTGSWSEACAYIYGEDRASYSYGLVSSGSSSVAADAPWWLDIETGNSWATSATSGDTALNIAAIQGFIAGLQAAGATLPVGVYSTASQWSTITGLDVSTTPTDFPALNDWVAGARSLHQAQGDCTNGGFTGVAPTLAQYHAGGFDADLRCG